MQSLNQYSNSYLTFRPLAKLGRLYALLHEHEVTYGADTIQTCRIEGLAMKEATSFPPAVYIVILDRFTTFSASDRVPRRGAAQ